MRRVAIYTFSVLEVAALVPLLEAVGIDIAVERMGRAREEAVHGARAAVGVVGHDNTVEVFLGHVVMNMEEEVAFLAVLYLLGDAAHAHAVPGKLHARHTRDLRAASKAVKGKDDHQIELAAKG